MLRKVSDYLRRCAHVMDLEAFRVAEKNTTDIHGDSIDGDRDLGVAGETTVSKGPGAPRKSEIAPEDEKPTASPEQRAPRRELSHHRAWNEQNRRRKMRDYMQQYRGTGRVNHPKPQTKGA